MPFLSLHLKHSSGLSGIYKKLYNCRHSSNRIFLPGFQYIRAAGKHFRQQSFYDMMEAEEIVRCDWYA